MNSDFIKSKEFLNTFEWRKVRQEVLNKYGNKCMCCGASPVGEIYLCVDHIKPRKTHPELALDVNNLQVLCNVCNHGKGNWNVKDWRGTAEFIITEDWLKKFTKNGFGITKEKALAVGLKYPVKRGWFKELLGLCITDEQRIRFEKSVSKRDAQSMKDKQKNAIDKKLKELLEVEERLKKLQKKIRNNP